MIGAGGQALSFEGLVDHYARTRPTYPDALYDALPPLRGATVLELGSGTGLATRSLLARGARVVATDLGPKMLRANVDATPNLPAAVCRAEALPVCDGAVDLVCGAQMWHWVDAPVASAEVARILRPGGTLALWWNEEDADGAGWFGDQQDALERMNPLYDRRFRIQDYAASFGTELAPVGGPVEFRWERELSVDDYVVLLRSKSYVQEIAAAAREDFLAGERARLLAAFPSGIVGQVYRTRLWLARR